MAPNLSASNQKPNKTQNYSIGIDHNLKKNVNLYAEANRFILHDRDFHKKYKGYIAFLGVKFNF